MMSIILVFSALLGPSRGFTSTAPPDPLTTETLPQFNNDSVLSALIELYRGRHYDYRLTPQLNGRPVSVDMGIYINNIADIDESKMQFGINIYLRQVWMDYRLGYNNEMPDVESISIPDAYYSDIWLPDTFIENGKEEKLHDITQVNKMMRVYGNGTVYYSQRLTLVLWCSVDLHTFPMDRQTCELRLMTYRYNTMEMIMNWMPNGAIEMAPFDLSLFEMLGREIGDCTFGFASGRYSCVYAQFMFKRRIGYYISQIYVPSTLVVLLSWVSFWLEPGAVPARVSLGLLTILTMSNQMATASASLPKVSYIKAIDIWLTTCLSFLFAGLVEFAMVNSMARRDTLREEAEAKKRKEQLEMTRRVPSASVRMRNGAASAKDEDSTGHVRYVDETPGIPSTRPNWKKRWGKWENWTAGQVDWVSRFIFPGCFLMFNLAYWYSYL